MTTAKTIASYFIAKANSMGGGSSELSGNNDLTNLKLQKILYFAQVEHLKEYGKPLFREDIQAWRFGPVVKEVYEWLRGCGGYVITEFDVTLDDFSVVAEDTKNFLDRIWKKYNKYSAWGLVEKTHKARSPWDVTYRSGEGEHSVIDLSLLKAASTL